MTIDAATPQISQTSSKISPSVSQSESPTYVSQASSSITSPVTNLESPTQEDQIIPEQEQNLYKQQGSQAEKVARPVSQESSTTTPLVSQSKSPTFPTYKMNGPVTQEDQTNAKQEQCVDRQQRHLIEEVASTVSQASSPMTSRIFHLMVLALSSISWMWSGFWRGSCKCMVLNSEHRSRIHLGPNI